jgi:microcystin-dependent protein
MADPYIGEIRIFPYTYVPDDYWLECDGQAVSITQYQALYAILGSQYGPVTPTTFTLPNLLGNAPIGMGQGPGLSNYVPGETAGAATVPLTQSQLPAHSHSLTVKLGNAGTGGQGIYTANPAGAELAPLFTRPNSSTNYVSVPDVTTSANVYLGAQTLAPAGATTVAAHPNQQPFVAFRFCIAFAGIYPIRP